MSFRTKSAWVGVAAAAAVIVLLRVAPLPAFGPAAGRPMMPAGHPGSSQSVSSQAFMYIDAFYVDPKRVVPIALLESAFRSVEGTYPEVIIDMAADKKSATVRAGG